MSTQDADQQPKTTHAQRRRIEAQEAIRAKLQAAQYIRRLHHIALGAHKKHKDAVPALALKANIYLRLLAKVLPDLKAVEHSGEVKQSYVVEVPATAPSVGEWSQTHAPQNLQ